MADAIVSLAVQKLTSFVADEVSLLQGVRGEIEWLRDELQTMRSFLDDADKKQGEDARVRRWVSQIIDVSYDAEDILCSFTVEFEEEKAQEPCFMGCLEACSNICKKPTNLHKIGKEIKSLKKRVTNISRRRLVYGITDIGRSGEGTSNGQDRIMGSRPNPLRKTSSFRQDHVTGFEDDAETLLSQLLKEGSSRSIVSIHGMGGLGKTTLARKLYNSLDVAQYFRHKAWVCVSEEYNIEDLLRSIIKSFRGQLPKEEMERLRIMSEDDLKRHLRDYLEGHCYLVVVDDVWHEDAFRALSDAFPDNTNGSKIIITTRSETVARRADKQRFVHKLRFLREKESWDLFCKEAFEGNRGVDSCGPAMMEIAEKLVKKCGGLPLAIVVLAGLLYHNFGLEEWRKVENDIWLQLKEDKIEISELLTLSYNDLPLEIKPCFLYVGMFPEDHDIEVERFIRLLIAEGFIKSRGNECLEEVAHGFVNELFNRSLIQVAQTHMEETWRFKVHDLIRDLAVHKSKEVNLFSIIDGDKTDPISSTIPRRYAIHSLDEERLSLLHSNPKIRTVLLTSQMHGHYVNHMASVLMEFKLLRVLALRGFDIREEEGERYKEIGKLIHLKFLELDGLNIPIPASIGNLKRLQSLVVPGVSPQRLPVELCKLKELRHLIGNFEGPINIEPLTNLRTLVGIHVGRSPVVLGLKSGNLRNLQELFFRSHSVIPLDFSTNLPNLRTLNVGWEVNNTPPLESLSLCEKVLKLELEGRIVKDPTLNEFPPLLTRLTLINSDLMNDPMPVLERLPNLTSLVLFRAYEGKKMVCSSNGFRQLEVLQISGLVELVEWEVEQGAMPRLNGLCIEECPYLRMIPEILKCVPLINLKNI